MSGADELFFLVGVCFSSATKARRALLIIRDVYTAEIRELFNVVCWNGNCSCMVGVVSCKIQLLRYRSWAAPTQHLERDKVLVVPLDFGVSEIHTAVFFW